MVRLKRIIVTALMGELPSFGFGTAVLIGDNTVAVVLIGGKIFTVLTFQVHGGAALTFHGPGFVIAWCVLGGVDAVVGLRAKVLAVMRAQKDFGGHISRLLFNRKEVLQKVESVCCLFVLHNKMHVLSRQLLGFYSL